MSITRTTFHPVHEKEEGKRAQVAKYFYILKATKRNFIPDRSSRILLIKWQFAFVVNVQVSVTIYSIPDIPFCDRIS